jgi:hypothetical protein
VWGSLRRWHERAKSLRLGQHHDFKLRVVIFTRERAGLFGTEKACGKVRHSFTEWCQKRSRFGG